MLPFLKKKDSSVAGLIIKNRTPDKPNESEDLEYSAEDCAKDLIAAVHSNDPAAVVKAIKDIMSNPDESKPSPHTYDAQNQKAAQGEEI